MNRQAHEKEGWTLKALTRIAVLSLLMMTLQACDRTEPPATSGPATQSAPAAAPPDPQSPAPAADAAVPPAQSPPANTSADIATPTAVEPAAGGDTAAAAPVANAPASDDTTFNHSVQSDQDAAFDAALKQALELEQQAQFHEAFVQVRDMDETFSSHPRVVELRPILNRLREHRRQASELQMALQSLASDRVSQREVARAMLLEGGQTGKLMLRNALHHSDPRVAAAAASLLVELKDPAAPALLVDLLETGPDPTLRTAAAAALTQLAPLADDALIARIYQHYRACELDAALELASFLAAVYSHQCQNDREVFGQLVHDPDAFDHLNELARTAMNSSDPAHVSWVRTNTPLLGLGIVTPEHLQLWLLASQLDSLQSGSSVSNWPDASPRSHDAAQTNAANQPRLVSDSVDASLRSVAFDGKSWVEIPNSPALQITGDQTLMMWIKPASLGRRMNPVNKSYSGEYTLTLEPEGYINYYFGDANHEGRYQSFPSVARLEAGQWTHIALVRDLTHRKLHWYFDGQPVAEEGSRFVKAASSDENIRIGSGYAGGFNGEIDQLALYDTALTAEQILAVYEMTKRQPASH